MSQYIYSMAHFGELILDALRIADVTDIVEIGADYGEMSGRLLDHVRAAGGTLTSIDPEVQESFRRWHAERPDVIHVAEPSLQALSHVPAADAWIVDGDHNWYTVFNELTLIRDSACNADKPLLVFLHDVCWPCARRDFYYAPDRIPAEFRHPHSFDAGASLHWHGLVPGRGLRGNGILALAEHEGGPMNGVLTAVEDFIADSNERGYDFCYAQVPAALGLGVLFETRAPYAAALADHLMPWHENTLLTSLERNRLVNFLDALDLEDRAAA